jgi:23S rRNA pseudouridine1911/1915/1917 synthase
MKKESYIVEPAAEAERLDTFVSLKSGLTRSSVQRLIKDGSVLVNSAPEKASCKIKRDDEIELTIPDEVEASLTPEKIPLDIIFEDDHIIVVNKPPGMVIYPAAGHSSGTLMNALASHCKKLASVGAPLRPGIVHRLDKDTSGLIIVAKDDEAYHNLIEQFKDKGIEKEYMTLVYGAPKKQSGEINIPIGRSSSDRKRMSTKTKRAKEAITLYEVKSSYSAASLVKVRIITGRTHQIRVHFTFTGHPVLGDRTYGKKTALKFGNKTLYFKRQMLHAYSLKFTHPVTGKPLELTTPIPEDMEKAIEELTEVSLS